MWRTAALLAPRDAEHAARIDSYRRDPAGPPTRDGEFVPLTAQSERDALTHCIPSDEQRWARVWRVAPRRRMTLIRTLNPGLVTVIHLGCRHPWQSLADVERRLFGASWDDRI